MNQPKGLTVHFDPAEFAGPQDRQLLESLNLAMADLVNVVLWVWPSFKDDPSRTYEVIVDEIAEMVMGDVEDHRATALCEGADQVVDLCTRIYSHLEPSIRDLPDQLYDAVNSGLRSDLDSGIMHVLREIPQGKMLLLSMD